MFGLDRVFWNDPGPATIKATYTDRASARWHIEYTSADDQQQQTPPVQNTGDGRRKTASFQTIIVEPVDRKESVSDWKMDFRLATDGPGDVTITLVRVVKGIF